MEMEETATALSKRTTPTMSKKTQVAHKGTFTPLESSSVALASQVGGDHYKDMPIQPIEFILANGLGFCEGNIVKYICRYRAKGGAQDHKKVIHYAELLLEHLDGNY